MLVGLGKVLKSICVKSAAKNCRKVYSGLRLNFTKRKSIYLNESEGESNNE